MTTSPHDPLTLDVFLDWEREQTLRCEFDGARAIAMTGGSVEYSVIATNLVRALQDRLRGRPCRAFHGDLKILVAARVRYPDALVTSTPVPRGSDFVLDPVSVFEVVSPTTASTERIAATAFTREGGDRIGRMLAGPADLALPELGVALALAELYRDVELAEA
ncbi:MAG: Uma2 family endonuclease [Proteobacteria bacterium]|nr:Uma2 family endonuclease [Pseudomonadota bacterium]